jgi:DNA-binding protein HU-beta
MNKAEIVARIARDAGLTKSDALKAVDALVDNVTKALKKGDKVTLVGFGTFAISRHKARAGRNPRTGAPLKIPARRAPRFAAGKELKEAVR